MPFDTKTLKRDGSGINPVPQHFNPTADDYEPQYGRNGASRAELYGPDGNPISTSAGKLAVRASEVESLLNDIKGKDFATQTTLAAILAKIIAAPATEAKQDTIIGYVDGVESTLATLLTKSGFDAKADITLSALRDAIRGASNKTLTDLATALAPLSTAAKQDALLAKDFATQTTLAAILEKIIAAPATEAKQTALNALIGEAQAAPTANTLLARLKSLEDKIDKITSGTTPAVTTLSGSKMELYGVAIEDRPDANTVAVGATFTIVDDTGNFDSYISNGTDWLEV